MDSREILTHSFGDTIAYGREIGARLKPPVLLLLSGELGSGKTTLTKGIVKGLGAADEDQVTSPTFTLVHKYGRGARVYHVDFYRIKDARDLETLGIDDLFAEPGIVIVEWPENLDPPADWPVVRIQLDHVSEDTRRIVVSGPAGILTGK